MHSHGLTHDNITTNSVYVDETLWVRVGAPKLGLITTPTNTEAAEKEGGECLNKDTAHYKPEGTDTEKKTLGCKGSISCMDTSDSLLSASKAWIRGIIENCNLLIRNKQIKRIKLSNDKH